MKPEWMSTTHVQTHKQEVKATSRKSPPPPSGGRGQ